MIEQIINKLKEKKLVLLGFGRESISTYHFIRKYLPLKFLTILDQNESIKENKELLQDKNVEIITGENYLKGLEKYDLIIKTPGISFKELDISKIQDKITSQMELFLEINRKNVIGVSGTKGKSTTSSLIYEIIKNQNPNCILAGNIGIPLFDCLEKANENTLFVLEMSSHQLEFLKWSPHIGILLNLFEDHLDHAGSIEHYHNSKMNLFKYQSPEDKMIYCASNETLKKKVEQGNYLGSAYPIDLEKNKGTIYLKNDCIYFNEMPLYPIKNKRKLLGRHNLFNISVALLVSELLELDLKGSVETVGQFEPLPYRMEWVGKIENRDYYMSVLSTIPEATMNDIESLEHVNTLIFGGMDRGISYEKLVTYLQKSSIEHFICMPTTGYEIAKFLPKEKVFLVNTLEEAVLLAKKITKENSICLLSPAASSYEQFKNYEEKGNKFKELVNQK